MNESRSSVSRREFLAASGAAASALAVPPAELLMAAEGAKKPWVFEPVKIPAWVRKVTRMAFVTPGEVEKAAELGVQVCHGNAVWPYFPLRRDGGGLSEADRKLMHQIIDSSHKHGMKYYFLRSRTCWLIPIGRCIQRIQTRRQRLSRAKTTWERGSAATTVHGETI